MRLPILHVLASTLAAMLLFVVQPWAAKLLLPWFGGSASVWLTTLLFFQTAVFAGYVYAHVMSSAPRFAHIAVLVVAAALLPLEVEPMPAGVEVLSVLAALTLGLGAVIVLVAATTPLLHRWLAGDSESRETYALYAASNAGSLLGLFVYPLLVEPLFGLERQARGWHVLTAIVVVAIVAAALGSSRQPTASSATRDGQETSGGRWFVYAFIPASLLYGFTAFLTRDIASVPLLWVIPLAIYLVTFIAAFARRPVRIGASFTWIAPLLLYATALVSVAWPVSIVTLIAHLAAFVVFAMYFHGELSAARPPSSQATSFYLWVSAGGVAAGLFNAVLAPQMFDAPLEYPLTYGLALVLLPARYGARFSPATSKALHALMMTVLAVVFAVIPGGLGPKLGAAIIMGAAFLGAMAFPALAHVMLALFLGAVVTYPGEAEIVARQRSFYGTHTVERRVFDEQPYLALTDGLTQHGLEPEHGELVPLGYYHPSGPCGEVFTRLAATHPAARVAVVGLGVGAMSLYSRPRDRYRFFELDPMVVELAKEHFRSLPSAAGQVQIEVADGRLALGASLTRYDLIVIDAFSSDAIPTHLLTAEAFALYRSRLADDGMLLLHTSNRYLDVDRVAVGGLEAAGWQHRYKRHRPGDDAPAGVWPSSWVVAAPPGGDLGALASAPDWQILRSDVVWTDSYSSVLSALR